MKQAMVTRVRVDSRPLRRGLERARVALGRVAGFTCPEGHRLSMHRDRETGDPVLFCTVCPDTGGAR